MRLFVLVAVAALLVIAVALFLGRARKASTWDPAGIPPPWGDRPSIFAHVKAHLAPGGSGLTAGGEALPDDDRVNNAGTVRWAPGALEGVFGHHVAGKDGEPNAAAMTAAVAEASSSPSKATLDRVYGLVSAEGSVSLADALMEQVIARKGLDLGRTQALARWLVTQAPDRAAVKVGLALLGVFRGDADKETFLILGRHDEFTLFSAVALQNSLPNPEPALLQLAKSVDGWGRIQAVERLRSTQDKLVKSWLLREGYRNSIMYEYLAHLCATTGGLAEALEAAEVDDALLDGAGDLLGALIAGQGGPAEGMDDYADGAAAVASYLRHLRGHLSRASLRHVTVLGQIRGFLDDQKADWGPRAARGWTPDARRVLQVQVGALLSEPRWRALVTDGLSAQDANRFQGAAIAANDLGIDTWERQYDRVAANAAGCSWYAISHTKDRDRMARVVALAERQLPLERIATGPGTEMGLGPGWGPHGDLDFVLQELHAFPGLGWNLIQAGLRSPVIRNRNMALKAMAGWGRPRWPPQAEAALQEARRQEPDPEVRARIDRVQKGQSFAE
jgi:hypothetical protein